MARCVRSVELNPEVGSTSFMATIVSFVLLFNLLKCFHILSDEIFGG